MGGSGDYASAQAFLYANGAMIDLNKMLPANSGWHLDFATGISDTGLILGTGTLTGAQNHTFLLELNATPEPGTWALLLAGCVVAGVRRRFRQEL